MQNRCQQCNQPLVKGRTLCDRCATEAQAVQTEHNYLKKLAKLQREGKVPAEKGKAYDARVAHDDWCQSYNGGYCNCDPDITFVEITKNNAEEVAKQVVADTKKFQEDMKKKIV